MAVAKILRTVLLGRGRRREFWACVAVLLGLMLYLPWSPSQPAVAWTMLAIWLLAASRRLRAMGWTAWLAPAPFVTVIAALAVFRVVARQAAADPRQTYELVSRPLLLGWLAFIVLLGVWKSKPSDVPTPQARAEVFG